MMKINTSSIKLGATISYVSIMLNILIQLMYTPWMIHTIGVSSYGIYSLILSFLSYFLLDLGIGSAISKFISKYHINKDEEALRKLYSVITIVYFAIDVILVIALGCVYFYLSDIFKSLSVDEILVFKKVFVIATIFSICNFTLKPLNGVMLAYEFFVPLKVLDLIERIGTIFIIIVSLLLGGGVYALVFINGVVALIIGLIKLFYLYRRGCININLRLFDRFLAKTLFSFSLWVFLINIAQRLRVNIVPTILGISCGTLEISIFALAMSLEGFVWAFSVALNGLFIPRVTQMVYADVDRAQITRLMIRVGRIQLYIIGLIVFGFIGLGESFLHLWVGDNFSATYYVLICMVITNLVELTQQIGTTLSYVVNEVRYNSIISFSSALISLLLSWILAPRYGAIGCGVAVMTALLISTIAINIFYKYKLRLDIVLFFKECHLKILPYMIIPVFLLLFVTRQFNINNWSMFLLCGIVYSIVFVGTVFFCCFNKEEKQFVFSIYQRFRK